MYLGRQWKCCKISTIIGSIVLNFCNGLMTYWGNMSVYLTSYFVFIHNVSHTEQETTWGLSIYILFMAIGLIIYPLASKITGRRPAQVAAILVISAGLFACYYTVRKSIIAFMFTLCVCMGVGTGVLYASAVQLMVEWASGDLGLLISFAQGAFSVGGIVINEIITFYLNPRNEVPNFAMGKTRYFSQKAILDKVPSMFLVLGVMSVTTCVIGMLLLRENPLYEPMKSNQDSEVKDADNTLRRSGDTNSIKSYQDVKQVVTSVRETASTAVTNLEARDHRAEVNAYLPKEMLKTVTFYVTWLALITSEYIFLAYYNFFKTFGQIWIHDDHFLTNVGTSMSSSSIILRPFWGVFIDRIGPKIGLVVISIIGSLISLWYYFTVQINNWLYAIVTVLESLLPPAFYISYASLVAGIFGRPHFTSNYSYMKTTSFAINLVAPLVLREILAQYGWFWVFASSGISCIVSLTLFLWFVPSV